MASSSGKLGDASASGPATASPSAPAAAASRIRSATLREAGRDALLEPERRMEPDEVRAEPRHGAEQRRIERRVHGNGLGTTVAGRQQSI